MKQIHKAVQALESDIGFWHPSRILLKKKLPGKFPRANKYLKIIRAGVYSYIIKFWSQPKWTELKYPLKFWNVSESHQKLISTCIAMV